jgi:hypothetical protein
MGLLGLAEGFRSLVKGILAPEGRVRPDLPEMNRERATVLLSVVTDLVYELYTRPARLKDSVRHCRSLRREARRERGRSEGAPVDTARIPLASVS